MDNQSAIKQLTDEREVLLRRAQSLSDAIEVLKKNTGQDASTASNTLNNSISVREAVLNVFKRENRFLHIREITRLVIEDSSQFEGSQNKIRNTISNLKTKGILTSYRVGSSLQNTFWGSKNWLDNDGVPKKENSYNKEYIQDSHEDIQL